MPDAERKLNSALDQAGSSGLIVCGVWDAEHPNVFRCFALSVAALLPLALPIDWGVMA